MIEMPHLPDEVRASLPPVAQAYIRALEVLVISQDTQISEMHAQLQKLQAQVTELQARIGQTSQNSSRPPSSDPPSAPPRPSIRPVRVSGVVSRDTSVINAGCCRSVKLMKLSNIMHWCALSVRRIWQRTCLTSVKLNDNRYGTCRM